MACVLAAVGCPLPEYYPADLGDDCSDSPLKAVCSTDEANVLVCKDGKYAVESACADGCVPASDRWVTFGENIDSVCCDNGDKRECFSTVDATTTFED